MAQIPYDYLKELIGEDKMQEIAEHFGGFTIYIPKLMKSYAERENMYCSLINQGVCHSDAIKVMSAQLEVSYSRLAHQIREFKKRENDDID
jgi:hypothetical protein